MLPGTAKYSGSLGENKDAVCWQYQRSGVTEIVQRLRLGNNSTPVARDMGIHPVFIHIAVKDLAPLPAAWETDAVAETIEG